MAPAGRKQASMVVSRSRGLSFAVLEPVTVVTVAVEDCDPLFNVTVEGNSEHVAYATVASGVQVSATVPAKPFVAVTLSE